MDIRIKQYLSWSQYNLFNRSPETYRKVYILGEPSFQNAEMRFGSKIASGLEEIDFTGDAEIDFCQVSLPDVDEREKELIAKVGDMKLLIRMDGYKKDHIIYEYKTGHVAWSQSKVDKWEQLTFYAYVYWLITGVVPDLFLVWIPTQKIDGVISLTGEKPVVFHTQRTISDFAKLSVKLKRVWEAIGKMVEEEISN